MIFQFYNRSLAKVAVELIKRNLGFFFSSYPITSTIVTIFIFLVVVFNKVFFMFLMLYVIIIWFFLEHFLRDREN